MSREAVETLVDRWLNDPAFRGQVRADPECAIQATGVALDADHSSALKNVDWTASDQDLALQARDNKF